MRQSQIEQRATIESYGPVSVINAEAITTQGRPDELPSRLPPDVTQGGYVIAYTKIKVRAAGDELEIHPIWWETGEALAQYTEYHLNRERVDADIQELKFTNMDVQSRAEHILKTTKWKDVAAAVIDMYR